MSCKINPTLAFLLLDTEPALLNSVKICIYIYQKSTNFAYTNRALKFYLKGTLGLEALSPLSQGLKVAIYFPGQVREKNLSLIGFFKPQGCQVFSFQYHSTYLNLPTHLCYQSKGNIFILSTKSHFLVACLKLTM